MLQKINPYHILVRNKYEADDIQRKLKQGVAFAELAKKYSECPSRLHDGNLGLVNPTQLDSDFLEAYESLKPGQISAPIRTRFGWHIIMKPSSAP